MSAESSTVEDPNRWVRHVPTANTLVTLRSQRSVLVCARCISVHYFTEYMHGPPYVTYAPGAKEIRVSALGFQWFKTGSHLGTFGGKVETPNCWQVCVDKLYDRYPL